MKRSFDVAAAWKAATTDGCRVLVVEPSEASAAVVIGFLESLGAVPLWVLEETDAAIAVAAQESPELILMTVCYHDVAPAVAGLAAIRAAELRASKKRTPVIALSTMSTLELKSKGASGFDDYLQIPFDNAELTAVVGPYIDLNSTLVGSRILREFSEALDDTDDFSPLLH